MTARDLGDVERVTVVVHIDHPEDAVVFQNRLAIYPAGCFVLDGPSGVQGYVLSHPWMLGQPPSLNTVLGRLPDGAETLYLHDLALMPAARASGQGTIALELIADRARSEGVSTLSLLAVGRSLGFWQRNGFQAVDLGIDLSSYGRATFMTRAVPQKPNM